jgi:hypothetical protein
MINKPERAANPGGKNMRPGLQFLMFSLIFIGIFILGNLLGAGLIFVIYGSKTFMAIASLNVTAPHFNTAVWILQISGTTLPIFAAPVVFAYTLTNSPVNYLKPGFKFPWALLLLIFVIMFVSNPLIELLSNLNQKIPLPQWLSWMKDNEKNDEKLMGALLQMKTIWGVIANVLAIGLLTAIVEELMFRGVLQTIFFRWTKNVHAAVWITAILFSAFHMEFFGFLPRLLLGVLMGYFVAWSGSVWTGVWAHFINNSTIVVVTYLFQHKLVNINPDDQHVFNYWGYAFGFALTLTLLLIYRSIASEKIKIPAYDGEELG